MENKPILRNDLDADTFKAYYYLKSELVSFCKENNLQTCGNKNELTDRVFKFLKTGEKSTSITCRKQSKQIDEYYKIIKNKLSLPKNIDEQFEYNTYIRDFF